MTLQRPTREIWNGSAKNRRLRTRESDPHKDSFEIITYRAEEEHLTSELLSDTGSSIVLAQYYRYGNGWNLFVGVIKDQYTISNLVRTNIWHCTCKLKQNEFIKFSTWFIVLLWSRDYYEQYLASN